MKISKEGPASLGQLACLTNAIIDVLELKINKLASPSIGEINNVLIQIDEDYKSTFTLSSQWQQVFEIIEKMDQNVQQRILELSEHKYNLLLQNRILN